MDMILSGATDSHPLNEIKFLNIYPTDKFARCKDFLREFLLLTPPVVFPSWFVVCVHHNSFCDLVLTVATSVF